jgi:quinol monooxygenase YgiN
MTTELYYSEEQTKDFATIISIKEIKRTIIVELGEIAFKKWGPLGRWGKGEINGREVWGVMDYDQNGNLYWSHFNRLNTNRTGLTHLKNKINQLLIDRGINDSITFKENFHLDYKDLFNPVKKMLRYTNQFSDVLFDEDSDFYEELIYLMIDTWNRGKSHTQHFTTNYKKYIPEATGIEFNDDKPGDVSDMLDGIDCVLLFNEKRRTVQVKGVVRCTLIDNYYNINVSMVLEKYKDINAFVFYNSGDNHIYIFKNDITKINQIIQDGTPVFLFPQELLYKRVQK